MWCGMDGSIEVLWKAEVLWCGGGQVLWQGVVWCGVMW